MSDRPGQEPTEGERESGTMRDSPEFRMIARIRERLRATTGSADVRIGIGDDAAAVVEPPGAGVRLVSVDGLVEGSGFRSEWAPPEAVGAKAISAALSDIAAMGAAPAEAYVWLGLPSEMVEADVLRLCDGLAEVAERERVAVLGGDVTASDLLAISVTVIGHARSAEHVVARDRASAGDALCISGRAGAAAAGLVLLEHPELGAELEPGLAEPLLSAQLRPRPRIALGLALAEAGVAAMIDVSDGVGADAEQLAAASGLGVEVELGALPLAPGVSELASAAGRDPLELAAVGGEDYELLCAIPRARLSGCLAAARECGTELTEIGRFDSGRSARLRFPGGRTMPASGYDHRRSR